MTTNLVGASVWEQELYDHLTSHVEHERAVLAAYEALARDTSVPAFSYLAGLILDDERRHHQLLADLAETIRSSAELTGEPAPIPGLLHFGEEAERIVEQTERFLALEEEDNRELQRLRRQLRDVRDTTPWQLVVELIEHDNAKHRRILSFIKDVARREGRARASRRG